MLCFYSVNGFKFYVVTVNKAFITSWLGNSFPSHLLDKSWYNCLVTAQKMHEIYQDSYSILIYLTWKQSTAWKVGNNAQYIYILLIILNIYILLINKINKSNYDE